MLDERVRQDRDSFPSCVCADWAIDNTERDVLDQGWAGLGWARLVTAVVIVIQRGERKCRPSRRFACIRIRPTSHISHLTQTPSIRHRARNEHEINPTRT